MPNPQDPSPGNAQEPWFELGTCRVEGWDNDIFFPVAEVDEDKAKRICKRCPVITDCLNFAMTTSQPDGVWGGKGPRERREIRRKRKARKKVGAR